MIKRIPWKDHVSWKELIDLWEINDFELGQYIGDLGLKYDQDPKKIYDPECPEPTRKEHTYEEMLFNTRLKDGLKILDPRHWKDPWFDEEQTKQAARISYEAQEDLEVVKHHEDCIIFKPDYIIEFQKKYPSLFHEETVRLEFLKNEIINQRTAKQSLPLPGEEATGQKIVEGQKRTEQKARGEKDSQEVVESKKGECLENPAVIQLVKEAKQQIEIIHNALVRNVGFTGRNDVNHADDLKQEAIEILTDQKDALKYIKKQYLDDINLYDNMLASPGHEKRYFEGTLLQRIIYDQTGKKIAKNNLRNL